MKYAEVAVNSPGAQRLSFCYSIPSKLTVDVGQAIWVPFGSKILQGVVIKLSDYPAVEVTKEIADIITSEPLLSPTQVELACWMSEHYLAPLFDCIALMLPPGFERKLITFFELAGSFSPATLPALTLEQKQVINLLQQRGKVSLNEFERELGKRKARQITEQLHRHHIIVKSQELEKAKVKPKLVLYLKLMVNQANAEAEVTRLKQARAYKQAAVIELIAKQTQPVALTELRKTINCSQAVINALISRSLISIVEVVVRRDPLSHLSFMSTVPPHLTQGQEAAWQLIRSSLLYETKDKSPLVFLLHGVTGSGKTEIYLRALTEVVARGKRGICLVPEIALTPQTIERFASRFLGRVAVIHSRLSLGEQFDEWHRIKDGACDVVIGARSALFAPQPALGLIVIDEEHEWTYKQQEKSPRYHARDVAIKLAGINGVVIILGSATPDVETFYHAQRGEYQLLELRERITVRGPSPLPKVEIVDLKDELKSGNESLFSRSLTEAMAEALNQEEQVILFLNRRGTATFVQCRKCGFVPRCRNCDVALTYHAAAKKLICHHCRYAASAPQVCPQCLTPRLRFRGIGTQRVEQEAKDLFGQAKVLRWDRDATTRRRAHEEILASFRTHQADILIGTQMIAKGLDIPQITLAGIISADTGLNLPDFRAGERTFQLLCQVAGRAGRGLGAGRVIIQTYTPNHYVVETASRHDYAAFYNQEINYRRQLGYPPFTRLARLVYYHTNASLCQREAERMSRLLISERDKRGIADLSFIGPFPTFVPRVRGRYYWQIIVRGADPTTFLADIPFPKGWTVDVEPVGLV